METAKSKKTPSPSYFEAVGRRKEAVARVRLYPASNFSWVVNNQTLESYFPIGIMQSRIKLPLTAIGKAITPLTVSIIAAGGGKSGQADAVAHGLARALVKFDPSLKPALKSGKFLTRDARAKERRKFGLKKARKAPQWSKR
jgi:small subunit ribosomal protein S9